MGVSWQTLMDTASSNGWMLKYLTEFIATAFLIMLGNGAVANVDLKGTKGNASGWLVIGFGYGMGVMIPALMFGNISGNHINPAFTIGLAAFGYFPWAHVLPYIIAQLLGAMAGQAVVVAVYKPYFDQTTNTNHILGSFSTIVNSGSRLNGFLNEFFGSFVLFLGALAITKNFFGAQLPDASAHAGSLEVGHLALGFLVLALVTSFGGATGPGLNPARDLGPRILHAILPKSVLKNKADSQWWYAWVPVVAPIVAALAAVAVFKFLYGGLGA
ncbi:MAG: aquaporin family protein [Streptococcaceae bacterium]|jgi:glycerol uptake facilitator protein|nr:aquaporin family protein [Streptococcaceae bacterium]